MKSFFRFFAASLLAGSLLLYGCGPSDNTPPAGYPDSSENASSPRRFPYLMLYQDSIQKSDSFKTAQRFVFIAYDSAASKPWQLICYGQRREKDIALLFTRLSAPLPVFKGTLTLPDGQTVPANAADTTNFSVSNLDISGNLFRKIARDSTQNANVLLFAPYFDPKADSGKTPFPRILQLRYAILLGRYQQSTNTVTVIPLDKNLYGSDKIDTDNGGIDLNPCPPAHKDLND